MQYTNLLQYIRWKKYERVRILIVWIMILAALAVYIVNMKANDHPLCDYFAELAKEPSVEVAEWVGYPQGWNNYPQEWDYETITDLAGGAAIVTKVYGGERWIWAFRTLTEDNGNHDFCEHVLIVSDEP